MMSYRFRGYVFSYWRKAPHNNSLDHRVKIDYCHRCIFIGLISVVMLHGTTFEISRGKREGSARSTILCSASKKWVACKQHYYHNQRKFPLCMYEPHYGTISRCVDVVILPIWHKLRLQKICLIYWGGVLLNWTYRHFVWPVHDDVTLWSEKKGHDIWVLHFTVSLGYRQWILYTFPLSPGC